MIEGCVKVDGGSLVSLSESELVDCATGYGCSGGWPYQAMQWVINNGGLCSEAAYPYTPYQQTCRKTQCPNVATLSEVPVYTDKVVGDIDWRTQGAVTPIKDQGQCGSCWAFSTTGGMEGCVKIASGSLISMSEQQLVDCDKTSYGCNGGLMTNAYNYIIKHGGICSEAAYPYTARTGTCKDTTCTSVATLSGFTNIATGSVSGLQNACAIEPVSIAVDASNFSPYRSGIFSNCGTSLNHGITLVGYLVNQYWICKNSWGTSWGEAGYIRLAWGNTCGIANMATYPTGCRKL
jgi:C1A family cysteine protease